MYKRQGLIWFDDHYSYLGYAMRDYTHPLLALGLMGFGAYSLAIRERRPKAAGYLVFSFIIPLACAIWFFRRNAGPQYIFFAQSFGLILTAAGTFGLWQSLREHYPRWSRKTSLIILSGLFLLVPNFGYFLEANNTYPVSYTHLQSSRIHLYTGQKSDQRYHLIRFFM